MSALVPAWVSANEEDNNDDGAATELVALGVAYSHVFGMNASWALTLPARTGDGDDR
jgi:NO-binding membrane sensor protein with MHYT domain